MVGSSKRHQPTWDRVVWTTSDYILSRSPAVFHPPPRGSSRSPVETSAHRHRAWCQSSAL